MRRAGLTVLLVLTVLAAGRAAAPGSARGSEFGLPALLSRPSLAEQPLGAATQPDITPDGRYVVFKSVGVNAIKNPPASVDQLAVAGAIYRLDRDTGDIAVVAYVFQFENAAGTSFVNGADAPSISADGRYVLFNSDKLRPSDAWVYGSRVFIRDMSRPVDDPQAFQDVGIMPGQSQPAPPTGSGSSVPPGAALSDDGRRLIFRDGNYQLYWRDLDSAVTRAVSVRYDPATATMTDTLARTLDQGVPDGAVLSGDGTTVAWVASNVYDAVRHQPGEPANAGFPTDDRWAGVLWRRIAEGDRALIHQLSGPVDLDDPACHPDTPVVTDPQAPPGPCDNTQLDSGGYQANQNNYPTELQPLSISRDGTTVAFISKGHARGLALPRAVDAYVATVFPHQPRKQATQPLTRAVPLTANDDPPCAYMHGSVAVTQVNSCVQGIALSPNGRYVAIVTARTVFALNPPSVVGAPPPGVGAQELYMVDRVANTLQLLSRTPTGSKQDLGPVLPGMGVPGLGVGGYVALADDASAAVFGSSADNLVAGDANQYPDVFAVARLATGAGAGVTGPEIEQLPAIGGRFEPVADWALRVTSRTVAGGAVALDVTVPAKGTVRAVAVPATGGAALASAAGPATAAQKITLTLRAPARKTVGPAQRVAATATVSFTPAAPAAGAALSQPVGVVLVRAARKTKAGAPASTARAPRLRVVVRRATHGGATLVAGVPAAGTVTASATRGGRVVARARVRAHHKGSVRMTLRPRGARRRMTVTVRYAPAVGTGRGPRSRRLTVTAGAVR